MHSSRPQFAALQSTTGCSPPHESTSTFTLVTLEMLQMPDSTLRGENENVAPSPPPACAESCAVPELAESLGVAS